MLKFFLNLNLNRIQTCYSGFVYIRVIFVNQTSSRYPDFKGQIVFSKAHFPA